MTADEAIERLVDLAKDAQYQAVCANSCQTTWDRRKADEAEHELQKHLQWCLDNLSLGVKTTLAEAVAAAHRDNLRWLASQGG